MPVPQEVIRDDWIPGRGVRLEDGREWEFPLPRLEYRLNEAGGIDPVESPEFRESNRRFGPRFWEKQARLDEYLAQFPDGDMANFDAVQWLGRVFAVACELLTRNYHLTGDELRTMLTIIPDDPQNMAMWGAIADIARGIGPKPQAAG